VSLEIAAFVYHDILDDAESGFQRPAAMQYKHTLSAFCDHLDRIASSAMVSELVPQIDFAKGGRHLVLTFDDGGKSAVRISEILYARGWKAHFFVITTRIGNRGFLDVHDIQHIRRCGHIIGSHSHTHPDIFKAQPFAKMLEEWRTSCDRISQMLSEPCLIASVPGGDISRKVLESAGQAGIQYLFTSEPVLTPRRFGGAWILGRACPKAGIAARRVERLAQFDARSWRRDLTVHRLKLLARMVAPPLYQIYVRHITASK
jgi:hypothetical protein